MFVKVQRGSEGKKKTQNQQKTQAIFGSALQNRNRILNDKYNHAGSPTQGAVSQQLREFFSCWLSQIDTFVCIEPGPKANLLHMGSNRANTESEK